MNLNLMDPKLIALVVAVVLISVVAVALYMRKRKKNTAELRDRFGPEYDRAVRTHGSERKAEAKLADRETRVEMLKIRDLEPTERERYLAQWQAVQSRFVDYPKGAVTEADELVCSLMQTRGYPVSNFDQRAADISVDHPRVVENYRSAHDIALRLGRGEASTEDMRTAMIHYRSLFDELVQGQHPATRWWRSARISTEPHLSVENCYGTREKVMMKPSTEDKTTGKLYEVKGFYHGKSGRAYRGPGLEDEGTAEKNAGKIQGWVGKVEKAVGE